MYAVQPPLSRLSNLLKLRYLFVLLIISATTTIVGITWYLSYYESHIPFNTYVNDVAVENKTREEAFSLVQSTLAPLPVTTITLSSDNGVLASSSAELGQTYDVETAINTAFAQYQDRSPIGKLRHLTERLQLRQDIAVQIKLDPEKAEAFIAEFALQTDEPGQEPTARLATSNNAQSLTISSGKNGRVVDREITLRLLQENVEAAIASTSAHIATSHTVLTDEEMIIAKDRALKFVGFSQALEYDTTRVYITDKDLISLLKLPTGINSDTLAELVQTWTVRVESKPQNAVFSYNKDNLQVSEFIPPREGLTLDLEVTKKHVSDIITMIDATTDNSTIIKNPPPAPLAVITAKPNVTLANTNEIGINERIAVGESWYRGSIPSRIHNVSLAASKIANYIVKPGEEFSFNNALGDVSAATGYQSAYVIMNGQTVLGDGGGVCQVSTTLFRALLNGGLDITRRLPHSYRVGYYEQNGVPGIDATVFSGNVDLRFKNDTPGHVLIHTRADSKNQYMIVELYGTSDGRTGEIVDFKQFAATPAPPAQYIPDPSLAPGQLKQIDWAVGGLKTSFKHVIKDKNGNVIKEEVYTSNYRPWAAKYLQGV